MLKKIGNWWWKIYKEGKKRATYHKEGYYNPPSSKRAKAALLIFATILSSVFLAGSFLTLLIALIGPATLLLFPLVVLFFIIYGVVLDT